MSSKFSIIIIIVVLLVAGGFFYKNYFQRSQVLSSQEAGEKAIAYINENILQGVSASLMDVGDEGGVYKIHFKIGEREYDSYVTKDGRLLFPEAIDLGKTPEGAGEQATQGDIPQADKPEVMLFVMSFCPYGNQAEDVMKPVVELLGETVKIELHYIIYENYASGYPDYCLDEENKYCSMHGINELNQNIREMCVYQNQPEKFWNFLDEVNRSCNVQIVEECWEDAAQKMGVDVNSVKECQTENATKFAQQEKELNEKYEVAGSPDLVINGVHYRGGRTPEAYKKAICDAFNHPPDACEQTLESSAPSSSSGSGGCQ